MAVERGCSSRTSAVAHCCRGITTTVPNWPNLKKPIMTGLAVLVALLLLGIIALVWQALRMVTSMAERERQAQSNLSKPDPQTPPKTGLAKGEYEL